MRRASIYAFAFVAVILLVSPLRAQTPALIRRTAFQPFLVAISVSDIDRSTQWYETHFGFHPEKPISRPRAGIATAILERDGFHLELVQVADSKTRASALPTPDNNGSLQGVYKLGFMVADVDSAISALGRAGVAQYRGPIAEDSSMNVRYALIRDPDGNVIQLFSRIPTNTTHPDAQVGKPGALIRINTSDAEKPVTGRVDQVTADSIMIRYRMNTPSLRASWNDVTRIEIKIPPHREASAAIGAAIGLVAGLFVAHHINTDYTCADCSPPPDKGLAYVVSGGFFSLIGGGLGYLLPQGRWKEVNAYR